MKMRLGTGWYCWKKRQRNETPVEDIIPEDFIEMAASLKKPYVHEHLLERAKQKEPAVASLLRKLTVTPEWLLNAAHILKIDKPKNP